MGSDEQHNYLNGNRHEHGQQLAAQDGGLRGGRGEQTRQRAFFILFENALRGGCAGEESIENHHATHDGSDDTQQDILALFCFTLLT